MHDLIITGGQVLDGTGAEPVLADVAIQNQRITAVGNLSGEAARNTLDANGLCVTPGFIDIHSHDDFNLPVNPLAPGKIRQGVTTQVTGNCGWSPAPLSPQHRQLFLDNAGFFDSGLSYDWESMGDFLSQLPPIALNVAQLVGHVTVRCAVMGMEDRPPTETELAAMKTLLADAMTEGAFGFSTGLVYPPSAYADTAEIAELAKVAAGFGGGYHTHMRDEGRNIMEAVREAAEIGKRSGARVHISHLKLHGRPMWGRAGELLELIETLGQEGVSLHCDQYPYPAGSSGLKSLLPNWTHQGGPRALMARLKNPEQRDRIRAELLEGMSEAGYMKIAQWSDVMISDSPSRPHVNGMNLQEIGERENKLAVDAMLDVLLDDYAKTLAIFFTIGVQDMEEIMSHPDISIGSDGILTTVPGKEGATLPHPRYYGTFPRVLGKYARETNLLSLPMAVRKMTALPAEALGLTGRGRLAPGFHADIVVFDPAKVLDRATFKAPHQYPVGIHEVIVNGEAVVSGGEVTGATPGTILRRAPK